MKKLPTEFRACLCKSCKKLFECKITSKQKYCSNSCASKEKIRNGNVGFKKGHKCWTEGLTKETDIRISKMSNKSALTRKGMHFTKKRGNQFGANNPMYGKKHTEETKNKIGDIHRNKIVSKTTREIMRLNNLGCKNPFYGKHHSEKSLKKMLKKSRVSPNKAECRLLNIILQVLPNEYSFVGDGEFILGGKCPDFVNIAGKNKTIELFGDYWHGKEKTGKENFEVEQERISYFYKYGYQMLIIWEHELKDINKLKQKIIDFNCMEWEDQR